MGFFNILSAHKKTEAIHRIKAWLDKHGVEHYTLQDDLSVDVDGNVDLSHQGLLEIPVVFGCVKGRFDCSHNLLTSLKGCPHTASKGFDCSYNKLVNLQFAPLNVEMMYDCSHNQINTLEHMSKKFEYTFYCDYNLLESLFGCPENLYGKFDCSHNLLKTLEHGPNLVRGEYFCSYNPLNTPDTYHTVFESYMTFITEDNFFGVPEIFEKNEYGQLCLFTNQKQLKKTLLYSQMQKNLETKDTRKRLKI